MAYGLEYLHQLNPTIIHGDLKAANLLIDNNKNPRIADFGLATLSERTPGLTTSNILNSSILWMSPELLNDMVHSKSSDIWAFGCTLLEVHDSSPTPYTLI